MDDDQAAVFAFAWTGFGARLYEAIVNASSRTSARSGPSGFEGRRGLHLFRVTRRPASGRRVTVQSHAEIGGLRAEVVAAVPPMHKRDP
jgi:hypothetical protein